MASILLIDDNETFVVALSSVLAEHGHTITRLPDGRSALATILAGHFDILLTDLSMPGKDGFETIIEMRKARIHLPIIAISGMGDSIPALHMAKRFGAIATLSKPFKIEELLSVIDSAIEAKPNRKAA